MTTPIVGSTANSFPTPAAAIPAAGPVETGAAKDKASLSQSFDQFLLLLTTQLKNQDPLSPMDSTEFTNQLVSFSQVEQQIKTNQSLSTLVKLTNTSQTTLGLSYIGLNVDLQGAQFEYPGNGSTSMAYTLPTDASISTVSVLDKDGNVVYTQNGNVTSGKHAFVWDGSDNQNGGAAPAGTYRLRVGALDKEQKNISASTVVPGYVSGIMTGEDGDINLIIGRQNTQVIPLSSVTQASL